MASIVVSTVAITTVSVTPNPVAVRGSLAVKIGAISETETYTYEVAPVMGRLRSVATTYARQSWPVLKKQ